MNTIKDVKIIDIPKIIDPKGRGKLSVVEKNIIPFDIPLFIKFQLTHTMHKFFYNWV